MATVEATAANLAHFYGGGLSQFYDNEIDELATIMAEAIKISEAQNTPKK